MNNSGNHPLRCPEKIAIPYDQALTGSLWPFDKYPSLSALDASDWPETFCSDEECATLSGIPKPSLLSLQTAEVLQATKAPIGHGSYRRVWPLREVAVAASVNCLKSIAHVDVKAVAKISFQAAIITRIAFMNFVKMQIAKNWAFGANIVLSENGNLGLQISDGLKDFDQGLGSLAYGSLNVIPLAVPENGAWKAVDGTKNAQRTPFLNSFNRARFQGTVVLGNVFEQFERDARKIRT
ncbi:hypothetical protein AB4853_16480 [Bradyrhizobium sp. 1050_B9_N1_2]|uniref:hypothetical protein n=1 Tax=Bradyrhizobium sp. 1050_B9_N1_2 TaxID=3238688 RepID=UPI003EDBB1A6